MDQTGPTERMVKVRNPWGEWTRREYDDILQSLGAAITGDGAFWMRYDDFVKGFANKPVFNRWQKAARGPSHRASEDVSSGAAVGASSEVLATSGPQAATVPAGKASVQPAASTSSQVEIKTALDDLPSRLRAVELQASGSGHKELGQRRAGEAVPDHQGSFELDKKASLISYESLPMDYPIGEPQLSGPAADASNISNPSSSDKDKVDKDTPRQPALYAVIAAIAASCGYMSLVAVRCVGLLQELSPKKPLSDFTPAPRKSFRGVSPEDAGDGAEAGAFPRTRRIRPVTRLCCPTREPLRLASSGSRPAMNAAQVPPPLDALSAESNA